MITKPITIVELSAFTRRAEKLLSAEEREALVDFLAQNPESGDEIEGTGGVRKVRYGAMGKGKSGGVRVIYYYYTDEAPLFALLIYGKNEQADLTPDQRKTVKAFAAVLKSKIKTERQEP